MLFSSFHCFFLKKIDSDISTIFPKVSEYIFYKSQNITPSCCVTAWLAEITLLFMIFCFERKNSDYADLSITVISQVEKLVDSFIKSVQDKSK